ncbi:hypothetical protein Nit79A3_3033 [Nitrosomonas sp. Is79A3]|uniref:hypothetical protein n=1 Tax=Nitrosomonas sp. (strain Is79A3) TaxID=261292 RepID=UPI000215CA43
MIATDKDSWFPGFEFQDWFYQSYLVLPTPEEVDDLPGKAVTARKWARGEFICGQAFRSTVNDSDGYVLDGRLSFFPGVELSVSVKGALGSGKNPAQFEATGIGVEGPTKGAIYQLTGWAFPIENFLNTGGRSMSIRGSVWAVHGPDSKPDVDLGGMPIGTVGTFVIVSRGYA